MSANEAKKIIKKYLDENGIAYTKLTAKTVGFSDLARGSCIFVYIYGWKPDPVANDIKRLAKDSGFCVDFRQTAS